MVQVAAKYWYRHFQNPNSIHNGSILRSDKSIKKLGWSDSTDLLATGCGGQLFGSMVNRYIRDH
jgi:hypothetical protein